MSTHRQVVEVTKKAHIWQAGKLILLISFFFLYRQMTTIYSHPMNILIENAISCLSYMKIRKRVNRVNEFRVSWYILIDEKGGVEGRSLLRGDPDHFDIVLATFKEKLSKEYNVRQSSIFILDTIKMN